MVSRHRIDFTPICCKDSIINGEFQGFKETRRQSIGLGHGTRLYIHSQFEHRCALPPFRSPSITNHLDIPSGCKNLLVRREW
jgi:hypothetical protein